MQLKTILNAVEKYKSFVYSEARWVKSQTGREIEFDVQPRKGSKPICSGCGNKRPGYDRLAARRFEYVPLWAIPVFLVYALRRVQCPQCGVVVEKVPWASGKNQQTNTYRVFLARWAKRLSWQEVANVFGTSWCLLKRRFNLTKKQTVKLRELLKYNLKTVKAYLMREDFNRFWTYQSATWAGKFLREWCSRARRCQIEPMQKMAATLTKHEPLLLNWFESQGLSSGIVEGFNNKAKLAMRKACGFREFETIQTALFHQLGQLPEPKTTHRFC